MSSVSVDSNKLKSLIGAYYDRRMLRILLLGIISGFPWVLIASALSLWLKEEVDIFEVLPDITPMLASANMDNGEKIFKKCASCHTQVKGGENKVGPAMWGIVNRSKGSMEGFAYSGALVAFGGDWNVEELNKFLLKPKKYIAGTKMNYNGIKKDLF